MRLRGMICFCALAATTMFAAAQTYTVLHIFHGPDGASADFASVFQDSKGNLYGTTSFDGADGWGTVYRIDTRQKVSVLHNFTNGNDGGMAGDLVVGSDGAFYGGTSSGGANGHGTAFRITPAGAFSTIYQFQGGTHASSPYPFAFLWSNNALYASEGVIYRLNQTAAGAVETDLFRSGGPADGAGQLTATDGKGNFYGVGGGGDITCGSNLGGCGLIYKFDAAGHYSVLHVFEGRDGEYPTSVALDSSGNLYGTTAAGGATNNGTVFELSATGKLTTLYSFTGGADGGQPQAGVVLDPYGDLFGTTYLGGITSSTNSHCQQLGCGVVFMLTHSGSSWKETVLHRFNGDDGQFPDAPLLLDLKGRALYGTTSAGGDYSCSTFEQSIVGCGVVFKITP